MTIPPDAANQHSRQLKRHGILIVLLLLWSYAHHAIASPIAPEAASDWQQLQQAQGKRSMVVTANEHASRAADQILAKGGSAIDAAIAAQLVLGLVEPQSSGIGGGAFLLHWQQKEKLLVSYDGRETAPQGVSTQHFLNTKNKPLNFFDALVGGHAAGTPGVLALLQLAHQQHGRLAWQALFQPAIRLSEQGFAVSPRLHQLLEKLKTFPNSLRHDSLRHYFYNHQAEPWPVGHLLKNPRYAMTLRHIATQGTGYFYHGDLAKQIVKKVQHDPVKAGRLNLTDLKHYQAKIRPNLCLDIAPYTLCGAPPPSSGGSTVLQIVALTQYWLRQSRSQLLPEHGLLEASKLAFADRNTYIADPDFISQPTAALFDTRYLQQRATLISPTASQQSALPGLIELPLQHANSPEQPSTSHLSIVDQAGNVVSMTSSIEMAFGSQIFLQGFLLNNQLTDFSFQPMDHNNQPVANRVAPGKRPRSSMSPMIILKNQQPYLIIGSPGGSRIIGYIARILVDHLLLGRDIADSIAAPHIIQLNRDQTEVETLANGDSLAKQLAKLGHSIKRNTQTSGIHAILIENNQLTGIADPRREGYAIGH